MKIKKYTKEDIVRTGKVVQTSDNKYFLKDDGTGYSYWHEAKIGNGKMSLSSHLGNTSYDYTFHCADDEKLATVLNKVIWEQ